MRIYLDHNAGAPLHPAARAAMTAALDVGGNPSSIHAEGRLARTRVEAARRQVAALFDVVDDVRDRVVFTGSGTEAIHLAVRGLAPAGAAVVVPTTEHPAMHGAAAAVAGARVATIAVDGDGGVDLDAWTRALAAGPAIAGIAAVNHELGTIADVAALAAAARGAGARVVIDAVAAVGRIALAPLTAHADAIAIASHKLGGPAGVGALWLAPGVALTPLLPIGHQERGRRPGTENVVGVVGMGAAAATVTLADMPAVAARGARLEAAIAAIPGATIHGAGARRTGATINARFAGVRGETLVMALDLEGIAASSGAACSSGSTAPSPVLRALGLDDEAARGGLRLSLGPTTTDADIDVVIARLPAIVARARAAR